MVQTCVQAEFVNVHIDPVKLVLIVLCIARARHLQWLVDTGHYFGHHALLCTTCAGPD